MNKIVLSAVLASVMLQAENIDLGEITVTTATKTEKKIDGVTASVEVITSEDIEKTGASTLKGVLKKLPSLATQFARFPHPSSKSKAAISIRGAGANGTLMLIDGKRLSSETENPYLMDRIPAGMVEKIEIVKGSMSTLYGSDAIGGVINIITKKSDTPLTILDLKYGQNADADGKEISASFVTMGKKGNISYKLYGSSVKTTPFRINKPYKQQAKNPVSHTNTSDPLNGITGTVGVTYIDDSTVNTVGLGLGYALSDSTKVGFDLNYFEEDRDGQYLGLHPRPRPDTVMSRVIMQGTPVDSHDENNRIDFSVHAEHMINDDILVKLRAYRSDYEKRNFTTPVNDLSFTRGGVVFPTIINTKFSANVIIDGLELTSTVAINENNLLTFGAEYRKELRESSAINPNPASNDFISKEVKYSSAFVQDEIDFSDTLHATVGARYDNISDFDSKASFQAGIIQNLSDTINIRFNFAQGYRTPDIAELYVMAPFYKDARRFGAAVVFGPKANIYDIVPETSQTFELGASYKTGSMQAEIVAFHNTIDDKIALLAKNAGTASKYYTSVNLDKAEITGVEASLKYSFNQALDIGFNATYLDTEDTAIGKELTFTPDISASLSVNYQVLDNLSSSLSVRYIGEQYVDSQNTKTVDGYTLADISLSYDYSQNIEIYAGIDNILDEDIDELLGATVGRYFYTGLRLRF